MSVFHFCWSAFYFWILNRVARYFKIQFKCRTRSLNFFFLVLFRTIFLFLLCNSVTFQSSLIMQHLSGVVRDATNSDLGIYSSAQSCFRIFYVFIFSISVSSSTWQLCFLSIVSSSSNSSKSFRIKTEDFSISRRNRENPQYFPDAQTFDGKC